MGLAGRGIWQAQQLRAEGAASGALPFSLASFVIVEGFTMPPFFILLNAEEMQGLGCNGLRN